MNNILKEKIRNRTQFSVDEGHLQLCLLRRGLEAEGSAPQSATSGNALSLTPSVLLAPNIL